jgi:carotenoid cleavage dioxygenase-like enzyme
VPHQGVRTFTCPSFFFFHVGNAFESEDGQHLHVDLAAYDDPQILKDLLLQPLVNPTVDDAGQLHQQVSQSCYKRLTIPLDPAAANCKLKVCILLVVGKGHCRCAGNVHLPFHFTIVV